MTHFGGFPFRISNYICEPPTFVRWKRSHRKARINKKWHKLHGPVTSTCRGVAYRMGGEMIACPCAMLKIRTEYAERKKT